MITKFDNFNINSRFFFSKLRVLYFNFDYFLFLFQDFSLKFQNLMLKTINLYLQFLIFLMKSGYRIKFEIRSFYWFVFHGIILLSLNSSRALLFPTQYSFVFRIFPSLSQVNSQQYQPEYRKLSP